MASVIQPMNQNKSSKACITRDDHRSIGKATGGLRVRSQFGEKKKPGGVTHPGFEDGNALTRQSRGVGCRAPDQFQNNAIGSGPFEGFFLFGEANAELAN